MNKDEKKLLNILKESKASGAASMSCGLRLDAAHALVKAGLAEQYGPGPNFYRITAKGMKVK